MGLPVKALSVMILGAGIICSCAFSQIASAQTPYYQGKTITVLRGGEPGGTGDVQAKALIQFLKKHIPGQPTIIIENMPGAGG
jgi:tripartite-type tricarboxylate transporter receptor subunit TctC